LTESSIPLAGLYAITPDGLPSPALLTATAAALAGGCRWLQYRDKTATPATRRENAQALARLCADFGAGLIVNDDVALAQAVGAGVHLGREDGDITTARARLGPQAIIGASCYQDFALAEAAARKGASYVAFGAVYPSPTKPAAARAPLALLSRARQCLPTPVCAIGGITLENVAPVIMAGANMVAVLSDLFSLAPDAMQARVAAYCQCFKDVSIHARDRAIPHGKGNAPSIPNQSPEEGQPEFVFEQT
jgi:thiamine-phosphate pyrophosphorylase